MDIFVHFSGKMDIPENKNQTAGTTVHEFPGFIEEGK